MAACRSSLENTRKMSLICVFNKNSPRAHTDSELAHTKSLWDFFQLSSTCHVHLKIGTCSLYIMLNNNFNFHTPWDSQNPYNLRLNKKTGSLGRLQKNKNSNFQHYNILSAYEVKDETSTSRTYISLVVYHMVRSKKILVKKEL
jgi:hypothetical protein